MTGYNRIIIVGNLTKDPELKAVGAQSVCKLTVASNKQFKNKQTGAISQEVCFIDVEVWGAQADSSAKYLQKGKPVLIEGRLKLDTWKDQEGATKSKHSIVSEKIIFLPSAQDNQSFDDMNNEDSNSHIGFAKKIDIGVKAHKPTQKKSNSFGDNPPFLEDDLPF
jgi:single-strand DNA-binding protein